MAQLRPLILVWVALMLLLGMTVGGSFFLTGSASFIASMTIAAVKAGLVYWFYMHLREQSGLHRVIALAAIAWLAIMALLVAADYFNRAPGSL